MWDKKGGEKLLSVWWFACLVVVGVGITAGVFIYYSAEIKINGIESQILYNEIANCALKNGFLTEEVLSESFDVLKDCNLDVDNDNFYVRMQFKKEDGSGIRSPVIKGDNALRDDCLSTEGVNARYFPKCVIGKESVFYYQDGEIKKGGLEIISASINYGDKISATKNA